jgi:hypothetical protein
VFGKNFIANWEKIAKFCEGKPPYIGGIFQSKKIIVINPNLFCTCHVTRVHNRFQEIQCACHSKSAFRLWIQSSWKLFFSVRHSDWQLWVSCQSEQIIIFHQPEFSVKDVWVWAFTIITWFFVNLISFPIKITNAIQRHNYKKFVTIKKKYVTIRTRTTQAWHNMPINFSKE